MSDDPFSRPLVLATRNAGKLVELRGLLESRGFAVESLDEAGIFDDAPDAEVESYDTFEENALSKARWYAARLPGRVVLADDSGLVVDALDGAPGVRSKRFASDAKATEARPSTELSTGADSLALGVHATDRANTALVLALLAALERERGVVSRRARFVCAAAAVWGVHASLSRGEVVGEILASPRGDGGFGYDPVFYEPTIAKTFAEATREEKSVLSHRARAFARLVLDLRVREAASDGVGTAGRKVPAFTVPVDPAERAT